MFYLTLYNITKHEHDVIRIKLSYAQFDPSYKDILRAVIYLSNNTFDIRYAKSNYNLVITQQHIPTISNGIIVRTKNFKMKVYEREETCIGRSNYEFNAFNTKNSCNHPTSLYLHTTNT